MDCERSVFIEPVAPVVYLNRRSYCKWWPLVVVVLFVMAIGGFLLQVKAVVSDLNVQVDGLKSENLRLANKLEALAISDLKAEVAELKDENQRLAKNLEAMSISGLKTEVAELKTEVATLKASEHNLYDKFDLHLKQREATCSSWDLHRGCLKWDVPPETPPISYKKACQEAVNKGIFKYYSGPSPFGVMEQEPRCRNMI